MRKPRLLLDVDGIVADFVGAAVKVMSEKSGRRISSDDVVHWEVTSVLDDHAVREACKEEFNKAGFCSAFEVYDGAQAAVRRLQELTELFFVTAPMRSSPTWMPERVSWLERHFAVDHRHVVFASKKHIISGDFMVDDAPGNIAPWLASNPGSVGLLWDRPYNRGPDAAGMARVSSWDDVLARVVGQ